MDNIKGMSDLNGRTAIITGGTKGIGKGCADVFCAAGANVVICARGEKQGRETEAVLCEKYGAGRCSFIQCDVRNEDEIELVAEKAAEKYGRLDIMLNNAGYHPSEENIDDISGKMFSELLELNLVSMFLFCKYSLPYLRQTKGCIINMCSLVGEIGQKQACRYVATKGGIYSLTKALAIDEGKNGVRVNSVSPGSIATPLTMEYFAATSDPDYEYKKQCSCCHLGRLGTMNEVGTACLFLASDMAAYITGVDIPVSGGSELGYGRKTE